MFALFNTHLFSKPRKPRILEETLGKEVWLWVNGWLTGFYFYWDSNISLWVSADKKSMSSSHSPVTLGKLPNALPFTNLQKWGWLYRLGLIWILNEITYAENIACALWSGNGFLSPLSFQGSGRRILWNLSLSPSAFHFVGGKLPSYLGFLGKHF